MSNTFELEKYLGTWYELACYPSWFQPRDSYSTKAVYRLLDNGQIEVHNSTLVKGKPFEAKGTATYLGGLNLAVSFPTGVLNVSQKPNYVIDMIWENREGQYIYAVVTDPDHASMYLLSRFPHPSLESYNQLISYVVDKYDVDRLVQIPHFE